MSERNLSHNQDTSERIDRHHPEFLDSIETDRDKQPFGDHFGKSFLTRAGFEWNPEKSKIENIKYSPPIPPYVLGSDGDEQAQELTRLREIIADGLVSQDPWVRMHAEDFMVRQRLASGSKNLEEYQDLGPLELPAKRFAMMLIYHADDYHKRLEYFGEELPVVKKRLREKVTAAIEDLHLPITSAYVDARLSEIKFSLCDPLLTRPKEVDGEYSHTRDEISLSTDLYDYGKKQHVAMHEFIHALSGRSSLKRVVKDDSDREKINIEHQRVGMQFSGAVLPYERFRWLDEAITETIAYSITHNFQTRTYIAEREILSLLIHVGEKPIGLRPFVEAYFENYLVDPADLSHLPAWHRLIEEINTQLRPGFLLELDKIISSHGAEAGLKFFRQSLRIHSGTKWTLPSLYQLRINEE